MALTAFQRAVCRLIAQNRIASGESYIAGAAALNELLSAPRISRDVDLFHDTTTALDASWESDRRLLEASGYRVTALRERPSFVEAAVVRGSEALLLQWVRDSAFRFFPLVEHEELGLTLHPFDLATNKVLALVGRLEVRDWIDVIECDRRLQPLGYLAWAACGKDPGFSPMMILEFAARSHYTAEEIRSLSFLGEEPNATALSKSWRELLAVARDTVDVLPADEAGKCVLSRDGGLFMAKGLGLRDAVAGAELVFHAGSIRGSLPNLIAR